MRLQRWQEVLVLLRRLKSLLAEPNFTAIFRPQLGDVPCTVFTLEAEHHYKNEN